MKTETICANIKAIICISLDKILWIYVMGITIRWQAKQLLNVNNNYTKIFLRIYIMVWCIDVWVCDWLCISFMELFGIIASNYFFFTMSHKIDTHFGTFLCLHPLPIPKYLVVVRTLRSIGRSIWKQNKWTKNCKYMSSIQITCLAILDVFLASLFFSTLS